MRNCENVPASHHSVSISTNCNYFVFTMHNEMSIVMGWEA